MRIIIQFYYEFLSKKTFAVEIENENEDCLVLLRLISNKIGYPIHQIIAIVKRDNINVKVISGWPLSFYEIKDKTQINVEIRDIDVEKQKKQSIEQAAKYLRKLGYINEQRKPELSIIKEGGENCEDGEDEKIGSFERNNKDYMTKSKPNFDSEQSSKLRQQSQSSSMSSSDEENLQKQFDIMKILDNFLDQLIQETINGKLEEVQKLLDNVPQKISQEQKDEIQQKKTKYINQLGRQGWNPLHYAVSYQHQKIVKELIDRGASPNFPNNQGWSSLQLAVHKNNINILKILLDSKDLDLNYVTQQGTALHVACMFGKTQALSLLLEKNPDINIKNAENKTCFDICNNEECKQMLKNYQKLPDQQQFQQQQNVIPSNLSQFCPPKPPIVKGNIHKIGTFLVNIKKRYLVINPDEGTIIRYKSQQHYPMKPIEIIPLKDIIHIQMISKSWFMPNNFTYFEFNYPNRQVYGCKFFQAAQKWAEYLYKASVYSYYMETKQGSYNPQHILENETIELTDQAEQDPIQGQIGGSVLQGVQEFEKQQNQQPAQLIRIKKSSFQQPPAPPQVPIVQERAVSENINLSYESSAPKNPPVSDNRSTNDTIKTNRSPNVPNSLNNSQYEEENVNLGKLQDESVKFESFRMLKLLGAGSFGRVLLSKKKDTGQIYAIKALKKKPLIIKKQLRYAVTEANVLKMCNHPFVLGLHYAFQTPNYLYLVLDYCKGGDISSHLALRRRFTEEECVFYIGELVLAIQYIHDLNVVYRDLKPENILIGNDGHIKLADFGLSKDNIQDNQKTKSFCGTPAYLSPEMLNNKGATKASDLYGIGAVLYEMLTGDPPYYDDDIPTMYKKIKEGNLLYPSYVSQTAKNFINGLLDRNPKTRLGAQSKEQIRNDPFFKNIDWDKLLQKQYKPPITEFENSSDNEDELDDGYDKKVFKDVDYEENNKLLNRVKVFSFVRK